MTEWNDNNAHKLADTVNGLRLIEILRKRAPKCKGDTIEARAVSGSEMQGFMNCIEEIEKLCSAQKSGTDPNESL